MIATSLRSLTLPSSAIRALPLLTLAILAGCEWGEDRPRGSTVERPIFTGERAFELLERQVAFGPRVPGTEGHAAQLAWMLDFLGERADAVIEQPFTHRHTQTGDEFELTNVFARFDPEARDRILLLAHWDTRPIADRDPDPTRRAEPIPGANDGASGVAVLLGLAELLAEQPPPIGVDILLTDGEDLGPGLDDMLLGARHFAENLPPGYRPLYGVLVDMVADRNPRFPVEGYSAQYAPEVVRRVWRVAEDLGYGDLFPDRVGQAVTDDHIPLNQAGIRTINIIDFEFGPANRYWHTHADSPENTSPEGMEAVGEVLAELIYRGG